MTNGCVFQTAARQTSRKHEAEVGPDRYREDLLAHGPDALNRKELTNAD